MKKVISTDSAPAPKGPYSQAIVANGFVFVAGQGPIDAKTQEVVIGDIRRETELTLSNIAAILEASGSSLEQVVKVNVYLKDIKDFAAMNEVYSRFFATNKPARTTVQAGLGLGIGVEIDAIAVSPEK